MKKDAKTMKEVAEHCTQYCPCETGKCGCSNSTARAYLALTARITQSQMSVILIFTQKS